MQKITPFLWFDSQAEEAMNFYVSIFKDSKVSRVSRYGEAGPGTPGTVMSVEFTLNGTNFYALNGGPVFQFSPATSFFIHCETQEEVDHYWNKLGEGGKPNQCGWLDDKFGVTWQVVPNALGRYLNDPDKKKAKNVMQAMMKMTKLDVAKLQEAYEQA
ncbi:MAG TPA: VOC family protein [Mucilaginibacter sp.]|jgi:predicted 3-demethylubiquinone-9 3-methyltransferase (glyoxalase superfamily)|nr:VOC family protein [Mucilaginibacter sp.]